MLRSRCSRSRLVGQPARDVADRFYTRDRRLRWRVSVGLIVPLLTVAACGSSGSDAGADGRVAAGGDPAAKATFCERWTAAFARDNQEELLAQLEDPPAELAGPAAVILAAEQAAEDAAEEAVEAGTQEEADDPAVQAAGQEILVWVEANCEQGSTRRVAPATDADLAGLRLCAAMTVPARPADERSGAVLYGEADRPDPYRGPMLGVVWNHEDAGDHAGDGERRPVTVRSTEGVAAPITVFQQTVVEELGTVVAWNEDRLAAGLYGRGWGADRTDELVKIADALERAGDGFVLPDSVLPAGYRQVFSGSPDALSLVWNAGSYVVQYMNAEEELGLVLSGGRLDADEFEAFRFLTLPLEQRPLGDRDALVGNAWFSHGGPAVVTWREPDGLVVRLVGFGFDLDRVLDVARQSRELDQDEWGALAQSAGDCPPPDSP